MAEFLVHAQDRRYRDRPRESYETNVRSLLQNSARSTPDRSVFVSPSLRVLGRLAIDTMFNATGFRPVRTFGPSHAVCHSKSSPTMGQVLCGRRTSRTSMARSSASPSSRFSPPQQRGSPTSTERWCVLYSSSYCVRPRLQPADHRTSRLCRPRAPLAARFSQATGPSRDLYASFLNRMGEMYGPDKIKGASVPRAVAHVSRALYRAARCRHSYFRRDEAGIIEC